MKSTSCSFVMDETVQKLTKRILASYRYYFSVQLVTKEPDSFVSFEERNMPEPEPVAHRDGLPSGISNFLEATLGADAVSAMTTKELRSAQQRVWILENINGSQNLYRNNRLVARQWKASSCWWNLNNNQQCRSADEIKRLARSEVAGYRIARQALPEIHVPTVLHFLLDSESQCSNDDDAWAILAYVGPQSEFFDKDVKEDLTWINGMVKTRFEFGFEEPHPR
jgi:hypothetical protein